jgi:hypothetical protein
MNNIYNDEVIVDVISMLSGKHKDMESLASLKESNLPILRAFAEDNDIQEMRLVSTNIGFVKTYSKTYKKRT